MCELHANEWRCRVCFVIINNKMAISGMFAASICNNHD